MDYSDSEYFMRRAKEEALLALRAEKREIAAAHHGLSVEYAARARSAFVLDDHKPIIPIQRVG